MHAIQTSGNCVRNVTADHLSGVAGDEIEDPRPYCELLRQFSTVHPEFAYLPRKFKIAVTGRKNDAAAVAVHDIGLKLVQDDHGTVGFQVWVGGGLGRTPIIGKVIREFLPKEDLLTYTEAILRIYNLQGNRQNKYKARIKILVKSLGIDTLRERVEEEFDRIKDGPTRLTQEEIDRVRAFFAPPHYNLLAGADRSHLEAAASNPRFAAWLDHNVLDHKIPGYNIVVVSLKHRDTAPGDVTAAQLDLIADLADAHSLGLATTTHEQNILLRDVPNGDLLALWESLDHAKMGDANHGTLLDMICCPGLDFCDLANAESIAIANQIFEEFDDLDYLYDLGEIKLKMSGCINACGHHHVGHIGILGIDKRGEEWYQIMLGGSAENDASLGRWIGPALPKPDIAAAVRALLEVYVAQRQPGERFLDTYRRIGIKPFHNGVYSDSDRKDRRRREAQPQRLAASA
jgi:sulfite reductase (NADPH) hemoprotein beta-component